MLRRTDDVSVGSNRQRARCSWVLRLPRLRALQICRRRMWLRSPAAAIRNLYNNYRRSPLGGTAALTLKADVLYDIVANVSPGVGERQHCLATTP